MTGHIISRVDRARWEEAQAWEREAQINYIIGKGDDFNDWWSEQFDDYRVLHGKQFNNVLEVGCGPHTNIKNILPLIKYQRIYLEDPLIQTYLSYYLNKPFIGRVAGELAGHKPNFVLQLLKSAASVDFSSAPLESLPYDDDSMDLVVCINVLDHVQDFEKCMAEMKRVLSKDGLLVIGQDLSDKSDMERCPESYEDVGHPIKTDHYTINEPLKGYHREFYRLLDRNEGRNPSAHYGTLLGVYRK